MKKNDILTAAERICLFLRNRKQYLLVLSTMVVFITTYMLILPAVTLDDNEADRQGGIDLPQRQEQVQDSDRDGGEPAQKEQAAPEEEQASSAEEQRQDVKDSEPAEEKPSEKADQNTAKPAFAESLVCEGSGYRIFLEAGEDAALPEDTTLVSKEITGRDDDYQAWYDETLKALQEEKGGDKISGLKFAKFYDISLLSGEDAVEPESPVDVTITYDKALPAADADHIRIVHFGANRKGELEPEVLDDKSVGMTIRKEKLEETTFTAESFSVYAVVYTMDFSCEVDGKTYEIVVTYDENAGIPEGASLKVTEFADDSEEYQAAREALIGKKQSEISGFNDSGLGLEAFDLSIIDKDGKQVEPKAGVQVSMKIKHLPEEAVEAGVQDSMEIHHLNESSGQVKVETVASAAGGSIRVGGKTAEAEFQLESFSTFTISWAENASQSSTTLRWTYNNYNQIGSRAYVTVNYVDENGNPINRPEDIGWTVDRYLGDNGTNSVDIENVLAKDINGRAFEYAYINRNGNKIPVSRIVGGRDGPWNYNYVAYYDENGDEVHRGGNWADRYQGEPLYLVYSGGPHTTIHYGYMDGNTFVEFDEQPGPTNTSTSFGWAHLIYDFAGEDDQGLHIDWKYKGTYYHTSEQTNPVQSSAAIQPLLRYYNNAWRHYNGSVDTYGPLRNNNSWGSVADGSDIYVVYEKPEIPMGGTPTPSESADPPDKPYILKESVPNTDGTNTLSLSVTGSRAPMVADKVADVIVILDLSSSMRRDIGSTTAYDNNYQTNSRSRYYQAKQAVQKLADKLYEVNGDDGQQYRMGLVTFSNKATIRQYPTEDRAEFQSTLDNITTYEGSGTNWEHSLQLANQMAVSSDRATYIVFITDGEPSVRQTRGNLTNEQLSGVNNTGNPAAEGDIFHGGRSGGQFFYNNGDYTTPDFRDYLGNATFGGLMNNDVWDARNRNAAVDEVASIVGHNKGFYAIGVSSDVNYLGPFVEAGGVDADHYKLVTSESAFQSVIDAILEELDVSGSSGQAEVRICDGITDLTQTIAKVNQEEGRLIGADGNFVYYKSNAPAGWNTWTAAQKEAYSLGAEHANTDEIPPEHSSFTPEQLNAYNLGKNIQFEEWTSREEDGCAAAVYNTGTGAVEWNMGQKFMLEDGVTYKVSFICWPSQEAYDIIAKLENGTITFGDTELYPQDVWDQFEGDAANGYRIRTNEEGANTRYKSATSVDGNVTVGSEQDPLLFQHVPPMPLAKDKLNVAKTWQASRIDSQTPESVTMQVVGDDELYKQFQIAPTETADGSTAPNKGKSENIYISCGHLKVDKNTGDVVVYESGHDFTLREVEENSRHWDLDAGVCRPMKINTEPTMLVLVDDEDVPAGMTSSMSYYASGSDEYYRIDGKVYKDAKAWADITGMNTRRSFLDLSKEVLVDNEVWTDTADAKFTYKIKIDVDPTTLSWDPDLEKYIIISIRGEGYSPAAAIADTTYITTARLPSACGFDGSNDANYLVAETGEEFYLSIRNGWSVRFLNLPAGTACSIEEVLGEDSDYTFNNARVETRTDRTSAEPDTTERYTTKKVESSITETSTLYKVVYQNDAKTQAVQILKTGQDASTPLGGAKFDLYTEGAYTSDPQGQAYKKDLISSGEATTKGQIDLGSLPVGKYYLVETDAPDGYNLKTEPVIITVYQNRVIYDEGTSLSQSGNGIVQAEGVYQLKVTNEEGVALPDSGGPGTRWLYLPGCILLVGAGVLLISRRRLGVSR